MVGIDVEYDLKSMHFVSLGPFGTLLFLALGQVSLHLNYFSMDMEAHLRRHDGFCYRRRPARETGSILWVYYLQAGPLLPS